MKTRQRTKSNIATKEQRNNKGKVSDSSLSRQSNRETKIKMPVKVKAALKVSKKKEMEEPLPDEFLKPIKNLSSIFTKIDKLEKERREILRVILKNNRLRKRIS